MCSPLRRVVLAAGTAVLGACSGQPPTAPAHTRTQGSAASASAVRAASRSRYRLVHPAVAIVQETSSGPAFQVRVRFHRKPPSDAQGLKVDILIGKAGSDAPPAPYGNRARHCYAASIGDDVDGGDPALEDVRAGMRVRVSVRVSGQPSLVRSVTLRSVTGSHGPLAALGCGRRSAR